MQRVTLAGPPRSPTGDDDAPAPVPGPVAPSPTAAVPPSRPGLRQSLAAFRHRNFALFWTGAVLSNTGTWVQNVTVPYVVFQLTGSAAWVGATAFAQLVPMSVLSLVGGTLSDRYDRRHILLVTQSLAALVALALAGVWAADLASVGVVVGLVALGGVVMGINVPSWQAFVSELVPRDTLLNAVTLNSAQFNAARAFGPAVGGLVLGTLGPGWAFGINAVSFVAVIAALLAIRTPKLVKDLSRRADVIGDVGATVAYVRRNRGMLAAFVSVGVLGIFGQPIISLIVVFAEQVFEVDGLAYGAMAGAIGLGSVLAAPVVAGPGSALTRSRLALVAMVGYGAALGAFAVSPAYGPAFLALLVAGAAYLPIAATLNTTIQLQVDEARRGKVLALYITLFTVTIPIGSLVQGGLADLVGPRWVTGVAAALFVLATLGLRAAGLLARLDDERADA